MTADSNAALDVYVHDRNSGRTKRVSVRSIGAQAFGGVSLFASISASGRYAPFHSSATNLVKADSNGEFDVFFHDRKTRRTKRVSFAARKG